MAIPYTGFFNTVGGMYQMKDSASLAGEVDMNWILNGTNVQMRTTPLNPIFPSVNDTVTRAGPYGWASEYLPNFVTAIASQVQIGVFFGSMGIEFEGTLQSGGPPPSTPTLTIKDNRNGTTATALIQGSAVGAVNKVYVRRVGSTSTTLAGTRTGNGNLTITLNKGEYFSCITSTLGGTSANIGSHFYISKVTQTRADIRDGGAKAALELAKQFGLQVDLVLNTVPETTVTLWAIDRTAEDITTIHGGNTGVRGAILEIPRQIGFPPDFVQIQSYFVIPSGSTNVEDRYGIDNGDSVNDNIGIKSVFTFHCSRMDYDVRLGG